MTAIQTALLSINLLLPTFLYAQPVLHPTDEAHTKQFTSEIIEKTADWLVVGAGPAGIASIGVLLDIGVNPANIVWLDPEFAVGRLGSYYAQVPGNSKTDEFIEFINACHTFQECTTPSIATLNALDPQLHCNLSVVIDALRDITHHLCAKVTCVKDQLTSLHHTETWHIGTNNHGTVHADHVILATGSRPKTLNYATNTIIPLDYALDATILATQVTADDIVGVVGGSHSAILILKHLCSLPVKQIYNFYHHPLVYSPVFLATLKVVTGLKGVVAEWAKNVLEKNPPANLTRILCNDQILQDMLPQCTKTIYAIGYEKNPLPSIDDTTPILKEDAGVIAPHLYGIGIAFPEPITLQSGEQGSCIGLDCFMNYAHAMIPQWIQEDMHTKGMHVRIQDHMKRLKRMSDLFTIVMW